MNSELRTSTNLPRLCQSEGKREGVHGPFVSTQNLFALESDTKGLNTGEFARRGIGSMTNIRDGSGNPDIGIYVDASKGNDVDMSLFSKMDYKVLTKVS